MASKTCVHPSELALFHQNPRKGDVSVIEASLQAHDQYKPIVVNKGTHTGRPNEVLAGNHTLIAIRNLAEREPGDKRWQRVLVHTIDVDDDRASRIVLADNRTSELGGFDQGALEGLLTALPDLDGTGYTSDDLESLSAAVDSWSDSALGSGDTDEEDAKGRERADDAGTMLALIDVTVADPRHQPEHGSVWTMGRHTLVVAKLSEEHRLWSEFLIEGTVFAPYPEPYLSTTDNALVSPYLFVQPNKYLAGHLLDKHTSAFPDETVEQVR